MFDLEKNRPAVIDFGKSSIGSHSMDEEKEINMVNDVISRLHRFIQNPEEESKKFKKALNISERDLS